MKAAPCQRVGCVILAAGAGSRLGQPKPLLDLGGRPLVVRAAEAALASTAWPVVVVAGAHVAGVRAALATLPVLVAENPAWAEGMASSLRAGLATLRCFSREIDGAVFALCDQPHFNADVIARLVARQHASGAGIVAALEVERVNVVTTARLPISLGSQSSRFFAVVRRVAVSIRI